MHQVYTSSKYTLACYIKFHNHNNMYYAMDTKKTTQIHGH